MKIVLNDYTPAEIIRMMRECTELTQKDFAKSIHRSERGLQAYELGERNYNLSTLIQIANTHGFKFIMEKKDLF